MKPGDTVLLRGRVIKVAEDGNPMNNLVVFEHDEDKTHRSISYWFSDVFLERQTKNCTHCNGSGNADGMAGASECIYCGGTGSEEELS